MHDYARLAGYTEQEIAELVRRLEIRVQQEAELDRKRAIARELARRRPHAR
jgi:hypothetical protein